MLSYFFAAADRFKTRQPQFFVLNVKYFKISENSSQYVKFLPSIHSNIYNSFNEGANKMTVTGYVRENILYINLSGEMDECSAPEARAGCDKLIEEHLNARKIIINLSEVAFMDSTGIGFLIGRYKKASKLSVPLYIEKPNFAADKILNLSGIYSLIPKAE